MFYVLRECGHVCEMCDLGCQCVARPFLLPLGGGTLLSLLFGIPVVALSVLGLRQAQPCDHLRVVGLGDALCGCVHICFAFYLQCRLLVSGGPLPNASQNAKSLVDRAWDLVLYDVGLCLYVPTFIFSFVFGWLGVVWSSECDYAGATLGASILLVIFGVVATAYVIVWWSYWSAWSLAEQGKGAMSRMVQGPRGDEGDVGAAEEGVHVATCVPPSYGSATLPLDKE
mmetsp:Transcript_21071/g.56145  ORF Transcript_21071/g.56145 Transcript_21071/m.56145 type:complete len:227 (-) Transcript_21071:118-798(-)